jgi:C2H2-type zinc finger/Zinc finger, C2H2 type
MNLLKNSFKMFFVLDVLNRQFTDFCSCFEGLKLQANLINHLLAHITASSPKREEIEFEGMKEDENNLPETIEHEMNFEVSLKSKSREKKLRSKRFTCKICFKSFLSKQGLQKHFSNEHEPQNFSRVKYQRQPEDETASAKVNCELCPKTFKYRQGLMKHFDLEHNPANIFSCTKCNSRCKTLKNLHAHLRTHEPPREDFLNSLQCHKCLKMFSSPKQLSLHLYTHREKFFSCDRCAAKFNNREQIKNHVLRHVGLFQKKSSHQRIICDQCSQMVFSYKMKRHKLIHHSSEKPFKCDIAGCSAAFSDKRILQDHQNIHLNLKPYKCEHCPEAFRSGANLRLHRLRHTDPDRFEIFQEF